MAEVLIKRFAQMIWTICGELYPGRYRAKGMALSTGMLKALSSSDSTVLIVD